MSTSSLRRACARRLAPGVLLCLPAIAGCTKSEMTYHFAAADLAEANPHLTFYRLTIKGCSGAETSHLQTGYYDANALHELFGEVSDKSSGSGVQTSPDQTRVGEVLVEIDPASKRARIVQQNERFAVLFGTNADTMAQQIGAFADSDQTGDAMASLLAAAAGRDKFDALANAKQSAEEKDLSRSHLVDALKSIKDEVNNAQPSASAATDALKAADLLRQFRELLRNAAQAALSNAGSGATLPSNPDDAFKEASLALDALKKAGS
jgi:hypothetical protein